MITEKSNQIVPLGEMVTKSVITTDSKGIERAELVEEFIPSGKTVTVETTDIYADTGKVFKRLADGAILGSHTTLGTNDSIANYTEVIIPVKKEVISK